MVPTVSYASSLAHVILTQDELKSYKAMEYVESKMVLGLGEGSTMKHGVVVLLCQLRLSSMVGNIRDGFGSRSRVDGEAHRGSNRLAFALGGSGLAMPVEVIQYCWKFIYQNDVDFSGFHKDLFVDMGCVAKIMIKCESGEPFETHNKKYIVASDSILRIAGVVEHDMFLDVAITVIVAGELGVTMKNK
ncbi:hypothetical protein UlMin_014702 [Ulmus minor]